MHRQRTCVIQFSDLRDRRIRTLARQLLLEARYKTFQLPGHEFEVVQYIDAPQRLFCVDPSLSFFEVRLAAHAAAYRTVMKPFDEASFGWTRARIAEVIAKMGATPEQELEREFPN